ncbi:hypothetical protein ACIBH1_44880 [Nonomuraea sp. NPDC050663]|uniref:hypothetical protein n=1 Tax=Nonomuraea sp. NPDC050663 TaxID=3364370 RepID=UPI0037A7B1BC
MSDDDHFSPQALSRHLHGYVTAVTERLAELDALPGLPPDSRPMLSGIEDAVALLSVALDQVADALPDLSSRHCVAVQREKEREAREAKAQWDAKCIRVTVTGALTEYKLHEEWRARARWDNHPDLLRVVLGSQIPDKSYKPNELGSIERWGQPRLLGDDIRTIGDLAALSDADVAERCVAAGWPNLGACLRIIAQAERIAETWPTRRGEYVLLPPAYTLDTELSQLNLIPPVLTVLANQDITTVRDLITALGTVIRLSGVGGRAIQQLGAALNQLSK